MNLDRMLRLHEPEPKTKEQQEIEQLKKQLELAELSIEALTFKLKKTTKISRQRLHRIKALQESNLRLRMKIANEHSSRD